jgi:hypothetical protein
VSRARDLDCDVVHTPVPNGRSRAILDGYVTVGEREAIDRDVEHALAGQHEIGNVQLALLRADDPNADTADRDLADGEGGAQERAWTELHVDAFQLGEGRPGLPIRQPEARDLDSATPDLQVEAVDARLPLRQGAELSHDQPAQ